MEQPPIIDWPVRGTFPALAPGEVHVWCGWLDAPPGDDAPATTVLSAEERTRAAAFHFAADRRRYVAAHAMVRQLLARYLSAESTPPFAVVGGVSHPDKDLPPG